MPVRKLCPECKSSMELRSAKDKAPFWGCSAYPECRVALRAPKFEQAVKILNDPLFRHSSTVSELRALLPVKPSKVLPLIVGSKTPQGRPTLQTRLAALRKKVRSKKPKRKNKRFKPPTDPLEGIRLYETGDRGWLPEDLLLIEQDEDAEITSDSSVYPHHRIKHETLNPVQTEALRFFGQDCNIVVAAATSAGKTTFAEMIMGDALARNAKAIFLSPLRAVSQEKYDDWTDPSHPWSRRNVSLVTGDYTLTERRKEELAGADVIVLTSEMLDSKTRRMKNESNYWLLQSLVCVVDEAHLLTMEGRGDALECGIMRFTKQNPHARVVLLSATMPNVDELGRWLTSLNGKPSVVISSSWRPTELAVHWPTYPASSGPGSYQDNEQSKRDRAHDLLQDYSRDKFLVFVHSKRAGRELLRELKQKHEHAEFHNADLDRNTRLGLESKFREGDLRVLVCTSTLAYGINAPARRTIVLGINRGMDEVDPIDVKQMVGRAGRVGLDPRGDAYVLLPEYGRNTGKTQALKERYQRIGPIKSKISDVDTLAFHLTAEVAEGEVRTAEDAVAWYERSLAHFQGLRLPDPARVLEKLVKVKILERDGVEYRATMLGRVASWLYFSPFDVSGWYFNFQRLVELDRLRDDSCLAWALGNVKTGFDSYLPREHNRHMFELSQKLRSKGIEHGQLAPPVLAIEGMLRAIDYKALAAARRSVSHDADRITQAVSLIDRYVLRSLGSEYVDLLRVRLRYECTWKEAELCRLPGIGARRAGMLIKAGIESLDDVARKPNRVAKTIGQKIAGTAVERAKELIGD